MKTIAAIEKEQEREKQMEEIQHASVIAAQVKKDQTTPARNTVFPPFPY